MTGMNRLPPPIGTSLMICVNNLAGPLLVVGGGAVGLRKVGTLLDAGAAVRLVSPEAAPELAGYARDGLLEWERRKVERGDFEKHALALLALPRDVTMEVLPLAAGTGCLLNCCGAAELGSWSLAAQFRVELNEASSRTLKSARCARGTARHPRAMRPATRRVHVEGGEWFLIGVSSGGRSPAGSGQLKRRLARLLEGENG